MSVLVIIGLLVTVVTATPVFVQLWKHHPRGLFILFFAEMWERFSYYGMRALLIFYLTQHFLFEDRVATTQYASFTTLAYILPMVGGVLADRVLGTRRAIGFGAMLLVAGHLLMAVEGPKARQVATIDGRAYDIVDSGRGNERALSIVVDGSAHAVAFSSSGALEISGLAAGGVLPATIPEGRFAFSVEPANPVFLSIFYTALSLIAIGVGFLKSNISALVGQLYERNDIRQAPGYTLYFYGINLGAFWAAIVCGWLGESIGWWAGFGAAGVGMLAGYIAFVAGRPLLRGRGEAPDVAALTQRRWGPLSSETLVYGSALAGVMLVWLLLQNNALVGIGLTVGSVMILAYVVQYAVRHCTPAERRDIALALFLVGGAVVFYTAFQQAGTSVILFAKRNVDLTILPEPLTFELFGRQVVMAAEAPATGRSFWIDTSLTASQTLAFNAGFILILAPVFSVIWAWLERRRLDPDPVAKFGLALVQVGLCLLVLAWSRGLANEEFRMPLAVLAVYSLLHTTAELCLSPVGQSQISKLSPPLLVSTMMSIWFLSSGAAQYAAGILASFAGAETVAGQVRDPAASLALSLALFERLGWIVGAFGAGFLALSISAYVWRRLYRST